MRTDHFETFRLLFPVTRLQVSDTDMVYYFRNRTAAAYFEAMALQIILHNVLPLTATMAIWESRGVIHEISLCIELVPEEEMVEV